MLSNILRSMSVNLCLVVVLSTFTFSVRAQDENVPNNNVSMSIYHVVRSGAGQQLFVTPDGQAVALPGIGIEGNQVAVYSGASGQRWYVDKSGQHVDLAPMSQPPVSATATGAGER